MMEKSLVRNGAKAAIAEKYKYILILSFHCYK